MAAAVLKHLIGTLELHPHDPTGALRERKTRAYLAGEFVELKHESAAFTAIAAALLNMGIVSLPAVRFGRREHQALPLGLILHHHALAWNHVAAKLRDFPAGPQRADHSVLPYLRIVVIDVAVRMAAAKTLAWEFPPETPIIPSWARENAFALALRELQKHAQQSAAASWKPTGGRKPKPFTRDDIVERLEENATTVDDWFDGKKRPGDLNIKRLADVLAESGMGIPAHQLHCHLRSEAAFSAAAAELAGAIGWKEVEDMAAMLARSVRALMILFEMWQQPPSERGEMLVGLVVKGIKLNQELGDVLAEALRQMKPSGAWRWALRACVGEWADWLQQSAEAVALTNKKHLAHARRVSGEEKRVVDAYAAYELAIAGVKDADEGVERIVAEAEQRQEDSPHDRALRLLGMAERYSLKGNMVFAVGLARAAVEAAPDDGLFRISLAYMLSAAGDADAAVAAAREAWAFDRTSEDACIALICIALHAKGYDDLRLVADDALRSVPSPSAGLLMWIGKARMKIGDHAGAYRVLKDAVRLAPRNGHAHDKLAKCAFELGKNQEGLNHARDAHRLGVDHAFGTWAEKKFGHLMPPEWRKAT